MTLPAVVQNDTRRQRYERMRGQLQNERTSFDSHWQLLASFITPRRSRFFAQDANRGDRRNQNIIDSTATLSARTLSSGLMAGMTSPARPWFHMATARKDLMESWAVKEYLDEITDLMHDIFREANLYDTLPQIYEDCGVFGTSCMLLEEDFQNVFFASSFPIGSYYLANDSKRRVTVFLRIFELTVRQIVEEFGYPDGRHAPIDWTNISPFVRDQWNLGQRETWIEVVHVISPNDDYAPHKLDAKYKQFKSCYYETGNTSSQQGNYSNAIGDVFLRETGYDYFPVLCPRWSLTGEDVYGTNCPGMTALGDIKQMQIAERRIAQAFDKVISPPMIGPESLMQRKATVLSGDITWESQQEAQLQKGFRPAYQINPPIQEFEAKQEQIRMRIKRTFFEDLFLMMIEQTNKQPITAAEVYARQEEKLLAIGPVLQRMDRELLNPLINIVFNLALKQNRLPPPPPELQGQLLTVQYESIMAQAQKAAGLGSLDRFIGSVSQIAALKPEVMDLINWDEYVEQYAARTGAPNKILMPMDKVMMMRAQRTQQQQAAAMAQNMPQMAKGAKDLSQTNLDGNNALTALIQQAQAGNLQPRAA